MADLADRQRDLVRALVAGGAAPAGFDTDRLLLTRQALMRKRARGVAAHWPALGTLPDFVARFSAWAGDLPPGSARSEGWEFGQSLGAELPPAASVEFVFAGKGRLARDGRAVVIRWPGIGARRLALGRRAGRR